MSSEIVEIKKPKLKNPIFIEGLPGVGNVGRIAAGFLVEELKAEKFAELWSSSFLPIVLVHKEANAHLIKNEFFFWKGKKKGQRDLIILIGDSQSSEPSGHYEVCMKILNYVKKFKVKEMFTLAGLSIGEKVEKPKVYGVVNDDKLIKKYKKYGVIFDSNKVGTIVGASGLLIALGKYLGIDGICLLGETIGYPVLPDPKSAKAVLSILTKSLNLDIDIEKLDKKVMEMEEFLKRLRDVETRALTQFLKGLYPSKPKEEKPTYIG